MFPGLLFYTSFWFCHSIRSDITAAICLPPPVPVAGCLGDCHGVMCCWGVMACRKRGLCFSLDDMLTGDYIFRNVLLKKPRQTSGLQTVIHGKFVDITTNPSFPDFSLLHMPKQKYCHLNTCRHHTNTLQHIHVHLCVHSPSRLKIGGDKWGK